MIMRKLLLRADVPVLGRIGDIVKVSDGYARNYLLPQQLAVEPTSKNIERVEEDKKRIDALRAQELAEKKAMAERLTGIEITIISTANEQGVLFGSVGSKEIADALHAEGYNVEAKHVILAEHIKQVDKHTVPLELAPEVTCSITVNVVSSREIVKEKQEAQTDGSDQ